MLHELDYEEAVDVDNNDFLEDAFASPAESREVDDNILEIMDVVRERPRKSDELSDETMSFIANPKNKKSAKARSRHQNQRANDCEEEENRSLDSETILENCFSNLVVAGKCGPVTIWCMNSCLRC